MATKTEDKIEKGLVVAREAICITVGARPVEYHEAKVLNQRTEQMETVPLTEIDPKDPGDDGIPYAFKAYQKVQRDHPAVKACPGAFIPYEELSEADLELVTSG